MRKQSWHKWTKEDEQFLIDNYQEFSCTELAEKLGVTLGSAKKKSRELKLIKTPEALKKIYSRPNAGQFKQGAAPLNTLHDNAITLRVDKEGLMYKWIRLDKGKWEMLHVNLWKKAGNEIPEGYVVRFIDGNQLNCVLQNLALYSRCQNLQKNRHQYLEEHGSKYKARTKKEKLTEAKVKVKKLKRQRKVIVKQKLKKIQAAVIKIPKRQEKVFAIRKVDVSQCIAVKIDRKTIIYVKPGTDIEKIRKQYQRAE